MSHKKNLSVNVLYVVSVFAVSLFANFSLSLSPTPLSVSCAFQLTCLFSFDFIHTRWILSCSFLCSYLSVRCNTLYESNPIDSNSCHTVEKGSLLKWKEESLFFLHRNDSIAMVLNIKENEQSQTNSIRVPMKIEWSKFTNKVKCKKKRVETMRNRMVKTQRRRKHHMIIDIPLTKHQFLHFRGN